MILIFFEKILNVDVRRRTRVVIVIVVRGKVVIAEIDERFWTFTFFYLVKIGKRRD